MSLAPGSTPRAVTGKTPPPAPSAAYAKRARELQEESLGARYRPPALRQGRGSVSGDAPAVDDLAPASAAAAPGPTSSLPAPNFPSSFRRARAGTLPSSVQLAAIQQASEDAGSPISPTRPGLRHSASTASAVPSVTPAGPATSRLRSGSLTIPAAGLSNAFGPSIFSSSWLASANSNFGVLDELRSMTSGEGSQLDEYDVHTLDYLGLDDSTPLFRAPPPATVSELKTQAQAAIAQSLNGPSRMRASTVSNPYRRRQVPTLMATPAAEIEEQAEAEEQLMVDSQQGYHTPIESYGNNLSPNSALLPSTGYVAKGFKQSLHLGSMAGARPRAISVGNIEGPASLSSGRRATVTAEGPPGLARKPSYNDLQPIPQASYMHGPVLSSPVARMAQPHKFGGGDIRISTTHLGAPQMMPSARAVSPSREGGAGQVPSRSLWIGNLDPAVTGEDLAHVFAPYGAIESFRLLPEKECGFVNFVDMQDAIRAKDDVTNRLGGNIGMPNGQLVRIGFGKADSAPLTPVTGGGNANVAISPATSARPNMTNTNLSPNSPQVGPDGQLQSSPTRALWIGSIPATTTPATILSVFSPFGPIESARVLTHKNCGFINFEHLDDAIRARKALNGRDVLGSDVGAIRIGFARVPVKVATGPDGQPIPADEATKVSVLGGGEMTIGETIHALRGVKGASSMPVDQQVLGGAVENYRSNLLLSLIANGAYDSANNASADGGKPASITEQQIVMRELGNASPEGDADVATMAEFRPPVMYYTSIPVVTERSTTRHWDANKLREFRKRIDSGVCSLEEIDEVALSLMDGELVELASDWLGNTVVQKLFERCSSSPRIGMLECLAPHLAMIGIHKNGTWAAQKIIDCAATEEEMVIIAQNLRPYCPPLMLDQYGNYVVQCCLKFGPPMNEFIIDSMIDRLWEIAQGRFGARSMRAVLESPLITMNQQRRVATAVILNSIPLATNPNGALLLTWLLDASGFHSRYRMLAPRFAPHLSHLCTHKLASSTVLRIVNQKNEPEASMQIANALFLAPNDQTLTDILGDQVNGVSLVLKILQSPFIDPAARSQYVEVTKRVLTDMKVANVQAFRRLAEEVGMAVPNFANAGYHAPPMRKPSLNQLAAGSSYPNDQPSLAAMMAALQMQSVGLPLGSSMQSQHHHSGQHQSPHGSLGNSVPIYTGLSSTAFPSSVGMSDGFGGFGPQQGGYRGSSGRNNSNASNGMMPPGLASSPGAHQQGPLSGNGQFGIPTPSSIRGTPFQQQYDYQMYGQQPNIGAFHA